MMEINELARRACENAVKRGKTEAVEELGDVMIACMTELCKRNVDVEKLISDKIRFNELRT